MLLGFDPTSGLRPRRPAAATSSPAAVLSRGYAQAAFTAAVEYDRAERARAHDQWFQLLLLTVLVGACIGAAILGACSVLAQHNVTAPAVVRVTVPEPLGDSMASFGLVTCTLSILLASGVCTFYAPPPSPPRPSKRASSRQLLPAKTRLQTEAKCCNVNHQGSCQCIWEARQGNTMIVRRTTASPDTPPPPFPQRPIAPHPTPAIAATKPSSAVNKAVAVRGAAGAAARGSLGLLRTNSLPELVTTPISASPTRAAPDGSTTTASTPERRSHLAFPTPAPQRSHARSLSYRNREPLRILLVDDSPINIQVASKFLRILKIDMDTVDVAADGLQAVVCAERLLHVKSPRMPEAPAPQPDDAAGVGAAPIQRTTTADVALPPLPTSDAASTAAVATTAAANPPLQPATHDLLLPHLPRPRSLLVLMDLMMPVMDGYEAAARIRAMGRLTEIPLYILALTADGLESTRERCLATDFDEVLVKPYVIGDLRAALARGKTALGIFA